DSAQEEDRCHDHPADDQHDLRVPHRIPAPPRAEEADERRPEPEPEDSHPCPAHQPGTEEQAPRRAARGLEVRRVVLDLLRVRGRHAFFCSWIHLSNSAGVTTRAFARMVACPRPQSSVHTTANSPVRVGVTRMVVSMPGTASIFWPKLGTQNEWITSTDCIVNFVSRPTGMTSSPDWTPPSSGYWNFQVNCCPITVTLSGFGPACPFSDRTNALTMPRATTRIAGMAVHTISSPVFPCIGGPSASSSAGTRHFQTEYTTTAATSEKMTIEITVAN